MDAITGMICGAAALLFAKGQGSASSAGNGAAAPGTSNVPTGLLSSLLKAALPSSAAKSGQGGSSGSLGGGSGGGGNGGLGQGVQLPSLQSTQATLASIQKQAARDQGSVAPISNPISDLIDSWSNPNNGTDFFTSLMDLTGIQQQVGMDQGSVALENDNSSFDTLIQTDPTATAIDPYQAPTVDPFAADNSTVGQYSDPWATDIADPWATDTSGLYAYSQNDPSYYNDGYGYY